MAKDKSMQKSTTPAVDDRPAHARHLLPVTRTSLNSDGRRCRPGSVPLQRRRWVPNSVGWSTTSSRACAARLSRRPPAGSCWNGCCQHLGQCASTCHRSLGRQSCSRRRRRSPQRSMTDESRPARHCSCRNGRRSHFEIAELPRPRWWRGDGDPNSRPHRWPNRVTLLAMEPTANLARNDAEELRREIVRSYRAGGDRHRRQWWNWARHGARSRPSGIVAHARQDDAARRLATIPGVGPITASLIAATVGDIGAFKNARHFAAWLGLVPRQRSTGGKIRLGRITKTGNREIRRLLVLGATSMVYRAEHWNSAAGAWTRGILERRPVRLVTVALANKMARIAWALMTRKEVYRAKGRVAAAAEAVA